VSAFRSCLVCTPTEQSEPQLYEGVANRRPARFCFVERSVVLIDGWAFPYWWKLREYSILCTNSCVALSWEMRFCYRTAVEEKIAFF
jgi:hypothetical protein